MRVIEHYKSLTLKELEIQLNMHLGFNFDYKIFKVSEFSQFAMEWCGSFIQVDFSNGYGMAYEKSYHNVMHTHNQYMGYSMHLNNGYGMMLGVEGMLAY